MSRHVRETRRLLAAIVILGATSASAWTPYGSGPYGPGDQTQGSAPGAEPPAPAGPGWNAGVPPMPGYSPFGYGYQTEPPDIGTPPPGTEGSEQEMAPQAPVYPPFGPGYGGPGYGGPGYGGPGYGRRGYGGGGDRGPSGPLQISRQATEDAYIIEIPLGGLRPDEIQVTNEGNWISIGKKQSEQEVREDTFDQGRGFARSYSFSSGSASRRFSLPPDADMQAMTREESEEILRIVIPRKRY
jgi:HSP20 family molecular chaperone IbpA